MSTKQSKWVVPGFILLAVIGWFSYDAYQKANQKENWFDTPMETFDD